MRPVIISGCHATLSWGVMLRLTELALPIDHDDDALGRAIAGRLGLREGELQSFTVFKRSHDARQKKLGLQFVYTVDVEVADEAAILARLRGDHNVGPTPDMRYRFVSAAPPAGTPRPLVVGFGPCGIFACLVLAQMGLRPIILDRGKVVRERTQDTWGLWRRGVLDPESNVQFGEGGAGTFSDGKLYTQIKDPRYLGRKVLEEFVKAGAPAEILYAARPHIGTFRLASMVEKMRREIERLGGEIRFEQRVTDVLIDGGHLRGVVLAGGETIECDQAIFAVGHSARDTFRLLHRRAVYMECFAVLAGFSDRASAVPDRPRAARPFCRRPQAGRSRLQAGATRRGWSPFGPAKASACARAGRWWRRPRSSTAWSPTA